MIMTDVSPWHRTLAVLLYFLIAPAWATFIDNGDGTITDTATVLMWDKCTWGQSGDTCAGGAPSAHTWQQALKTAVTANAGNYKGRNDWRLPNINEVESLAKLDTINPSIDTTSFPNTPWSLYFWSSTTGASPDDAAYFDFGPGWAYWDMKTFTYHVRLVRSGQSFAPFDLLVTAPLITSGTPSGGTMGILYTFMVIASGSPTFSATGLPPGLVIDPASGVISGTPTVPGSYSVTITATNAGGAATQNVTMAIGGSMAVQGIPTLSEWGVLLLSMLLGIVGWYRLRSEALFN